MQKRSGGTKKYSWSISSKRDQKYNETIKNDYMAKKITQFQKQLPGIRSYTTIF